MRGYFGFADRKVKRPVQWQAGSNLRNHWGCHRDWKHLEVPADGRCQWGWIVPRSLVDFPLPLVGPPDNRRVRIGEEEQGRHRWHVPDIRRTKVRMDGPMDRMDKLCNRVLLRGCHRLVLELLPDCHQGGPLGRGGHDRGLELIPPGP